MKDAPKNFNNNAPMNPKITDAAGYKIIEPEELIPGDEIKPSGGTVMAAIAGNETNSLESMPLKGLADAGEKPLMALGKQVVKASGKK